MAKINVKPILFNTEMVRAILDGRKTVTRYIKDRYLEHMKRKEAWRKKHTVKRRMKSENNQKKNDS